MRQAFALVTLLIVAGPASVPVLACLTHLPREPGRVAGLTLTTIALAGLAVAVAVPLGSVVGLALGRARRLAWAGWVAVAVGAAVPLPVVAVAWQVVLGGLLPAAGLAPGEPAAWRPWREGLFPAGLVHGLAGVPWVAAAVALAVRTADRNLEEVARLAGGWVAVVRRVILPRAALGALAAGGWVALQPVTEIPVTDAMLVRTAAEEVYTQMVTDAGGVPAAVALALPAWLLSGGVAWVVLGRARRSLGHSSGVGLDPVSTGAPGWVRFGLMLAALLVGLGAVGLPLAALAWKAGGGASRAGFAPHTLAVGLGDVARTDGVTLAESLLAAGGTGLVTAGLAAGAAWQMRTSHFAERGWLVVAVVAAVTPGPVVGLGLKTIIRVVVDAEAGLLAATGVSLTFLPAASMLYDQPSPVPAVWAAVARLFPVALMVLWPAARLVPQGLIDQARLDGFGLVGTVRRVAWPQLGPAMLAAAVAVAALALGEVSASRQVDPAGRGAYVLRLFAQMHYGAESAVAAMALVQVAAVGLVVAVGAWAARSGREAA